MRSGKRMVGLAILSMAAGPMAAVADTADAMRAALAGVPQEAGGPIGPVFSDIDVATAVVAGQDMSRRAPIFSGPAGGLYLAPPLSGQLYVGENVDNAWEPRVGFGPADVSTIVAAGDPPEWLLQIGLRPGAVDDVPAALTANGYERADTSFGPLFLRGEADYAISLEARDPSDPFGGQLGQSSRVLLMGDLVIRAAGMPPLERAMSGPFWGGRADLAAILDAFDGLAEGTAILRAMILVDQGMFPAGADAATVLDRAAEGGIAPGVPAWSLAVAAETVLPDGGAGAAVAIVYATTEQAEEAVARIGAGWNIPGPRTRQSPEETMGPVTLGISGEGSFVVMAEVTGSWSQEGILRNGAATGLWNGIMSADLAVFGVGP